MAKEKGMGGHSVACCQFALLQGSWLALLTLTRAPWFLLVPGWYLLLPLLPSLPAGGFGLAESKEQPVEQRLA